MAQIDRNELDYLKKSVMPLWSLRDQFLITFESWLRSWYWELDSMHGSHCVLNRDEYRFLVLKLGEIIGRTKTVEQCEGEIITLLEKEHLIEKQTSRGPATFKELRRSPGWLSTLRMLTKTGKTIMVAEGPASMGHYSAVVLTGRGFQLENGKSGMSAAYSRNPPTHSPIVSTRELVEAVLELSQPLPDDPPGTSTPIEEEIVAKLLRNIEEIRGNAAAK
jgi:hypothetical protein